MSKADITINGRRYSIACAPGREERLGALAGQLNARIKLIASAVGDIGEERLLLIAALALLDEIDGLKNAPPGDAEQKAATALSAAAERISAIAQRIEGGS